MTRHDERELRRSDRKFGAEYALYCLGQEVERRIEIANAGTGGYGDAYRREIARLWRVALRAAKAAAK